ncbi:MAG: hypothetical protein ACQEW7_08400 [Pseudomonadota bacterium]
MARVTKGMLMVTLVAMLPVAAWAENWAGAEPMSAEQLEAASGRQGVPLQWQLNEAEQNAVVSGNVLSGPVNTGDNWIADQAFENMSGIATVIQNTGNQVVIQDSTQINILINH